ncbi:MAG TPA: hypothetical protein VGP92_02270, partial [Acidimicrobiia bacterium]|nr:hypothetical protein [Acidimicrobiia bacterium]
MPLVIALLVVGALLASWLYWPRSARAPYRQATDVELFTSRRTTLTRVFVAVSEGLSSAAGGRPAARNSITAVTLGLELKAAPG